MWRSKGLNISCFSRTFDNVTNNSFHFYRKFLSYGQLPPPLRDLAREEGVGEAREEVCMIGWKGDLLIKIFHKIGWIGEYFNDWLDRRVFDQNISMTQNL